MEHRTTYTPNWECLARGPINPTHIVLTGGYAESPNGHLIWHRIESYLHRMQPRGLEL